MNRPESITLEGDLPLKREEKTSTTNLLFEEHFVAVFRFLSRRAASKEDAEDVAAETFAAALQHRCPKNVHPRAWLYGIARRKLADAYRRRRREKRGSMDDAAGLSYELKDDAADLRSLIDRLPEDQKEALLLQTLEELSLSEIAHVMGRSQGSVKALLQRAKERVRRESQGRFDPEVNS